MFYVNSKGKVALMGGAINFPSIKTLAQHKFKRKQGFDDVITYIHYSYSKDINNPYRFLFPHERKEDVYRDHNIFSWDKGMDYTKFENIPVIADALETYQRVMITPAGRMLEAMHARMEKYQKAMAESPIGKPKDEKERFDSLLSMQKLVKEYEKEAMVQQEEEEWKENMRLFEIPDDQWHV